MSLTTYNQDVNEITVTVTTCPETAMLIASWDDPSGLGGLTTQAATLTELSANIMEAVDCHFGPDNIPGKVRVHFADDPVLAAA